LFQEKSQLEAILSAIGEGIIIIGLDKKITYQNERALKMFGDYIGKSCFSIYHSGGKPCKNCPVARSIKADAIINDVHSSIDTDGNLRYYELTAAPVKEDGKVIANVEVVRDITARKLLEEELQRTTRRLQTVIGRMKSGLLYANRRDEIAIGNDNALDFFSVKLNEKLYGPVENDNKKILQKVIKAFRDDTSVNYYEKNIKRDDKWYSVIFSASRSLTGEYYGTIANIVDISNMKKLEGLKEDLTHMIVHDMKNPLNSIMYVLEMAADGMVKGLDPAEKKLFEMAHKDSKTLLNMVQGMLDISKMEEGEHILNKRETYFKNTIKNSIAEVNFLAQARGIRIKEIYNTDMVAIEADDDYLERVIVNLLANAIKFSKEGTDILVMADDHEKKGKKSVKISVVNEGPDIPKTSIKTIFDKYKQAEQRASGKIAGTGLGLTFCHLAIESHGGEIWVESPPKEFSSGAKFSLTIPVQAAPGKRCVDPNI
jgi:PAS domain S-box-containing protein